jgi:hypothetical protein
MAGVTNNRYRRIGWPRSTPLAQSRMTTQLATVHYVTSHFQVLQGLRIVPVALYLLIGGLGSLEWTPWLDFISGMPKSGLIPLAVTVLLYGFISMYYRRRFGKVVRVQGAKKQVWILVAVAVAFPIGVFINAAFELPVDAVMILMAAVCLYAGLDGSRRYGHLLLSALFVFWAIHPLLFDSLENFPFTVMTVTFGVGFLLIGIYDHLILVRALRTTRQWQEQHG